MSQPDINAPPLLKGSQAITSIYTFLRKIKKVSILSTEFTVFNQSTTQFNLCNMLHL